MFPKQAKRLALQRLREVDPAVLYADFSACDAFDVSARVAEINFPALIVCGQLDKMTPVKYSERLHAQIQQSELHLLDNAGHMVMIERNSLDVAKLVDDWLVGAVKE